jgi:hypothetical protein
MKSHLHFKIGFDPTQHVVGTPSIADVSSHAWSIGAMHVQRIIRKLKVMHVSGRCYTRNLFRPISIHPCCCPIEGGVIMVGRTAVRNVNDFQVFKAHFAIGWYPGLNYLVEISHVGGFKCVLPCII